VKILIAGFGSIGRRHFQNLLALGERDILFYRSGRSTLPDDELKGYPVETSLEAALSHRPQAVIVANPTALHLDVAFPAAEAGCSLFIEKPVSHSLERLPELAAAVQRSGSRVLVGYQFRFHPGLRQVQQLVEAGEIGYLVSARAHWGEYLPGWHPWEDYRQGYSARQDLGGGVTLTLSHPLDYLRWLFGEIASLWAFTGQLSGLDLSVEDAAEIGLRFASGALGSLHLDYCQRPPEHRLEVIGRLGTIRWDNADGGIRLWRLGLDLWRHYPAPAGFERNTLFLDQMRHFLAVARGEVEPLCTLEDGLQALRLALAAAQSQSQGQRIDL
jgi:predicted dehydrogenase